MAAALAAIAKEASEGDASATAVLEDLKANHVPAAVRALNADALIKEGVATRTGTVDDAKEAASAWRTLGALAYLIEDRKALAAYTKASALDRDDVASVFWVGNIQTDHENYDEATSRMRRIGELTKADPAGLYAVWASQVIGSIAMLQRRGDDALAAYHATRRLVDQHIQANAHDAIWRYESYYTAVQLVAAQLTRHDYDAALTATAEELATIDGLASSASDDVMLQHDHAAVYGDIGSVRAARGDKQEALEAYNTQLAMAAAAVRARPADTSRLHDLESAYRELGLAQADNNDAVRSISDALTLADQIAALDPRDADRIGDRAMLQEDLGDVQTAIGDLTAADRSYVIAFETLGRTQQMEPEEQRWRLDLVRLLNKMGDEQARRGDLDSALASYRGNLSVGSQLATKRPNDILLQGALFVASRGLGDVQQRRGDYPAALAAFKTALEIDLQALRAAPHNRRIVLDMASVFSRIGSILAAKGDLVNGKTAYDKAVSVLLALSQLEPNNQETRHNLAVAYDSLREMQWKLKDAANAATSMQAAQKILVANQTDREWRHDLALSYSQYGALEVGRNNFDAGLRALKNAETLFHKTVDDEPDDVDAQHDLAIAYLNAARGLETSGKLSLALDEVREGQIFLKRATRNPKERERWKDDLAQFDEEVAMLEDLARKGHI